MREAGRPDEMKNIISYLSARPQTCDVSLLQRFDNVQAFNVWKQLRQVIVIQRFSFHCLSLTEVLGHF